MREIKFRAWDEREKKIIYGSEVSIFNEEDNGFHSGRLVADGDWLDMPLMQYTGLKDKNGKEVWEGDLVVASSRKNDIDCMPIIIKYVTTPYTSAFDFGTLPPSHLTEIIGNIYENPELLDMP